MMDDAKSKDTTGLSRRDLLRGVTTSAASFMIVPRHVLEAQVMYLRATR